MQLELLPVLVPIVAKSSKTPEQEAAFQALLAEAQRKRQKKTRSVANSPGFVGIRDCPIDQLRIVCDTWREANGWQLVQTIDRVPSPKRRSHHSSNGLLPPSSDRA